jgi:hypothetical protein
MGQARNIYAICRGLQSKDSLQSGTHALVLVLARALAV